MTVHVYGIFLMHLLVDGQLSCNEYCRDKQQSAGISVTDWLDFFDYLLRVVQVVHMLILVLVARGSSMPIPTAENTV